MNIQIAIVHEAPNVNGKGLRLADDITPLGDRTLWEKKIKSVLDSLKPFEVDPVNRSSNIVLKEFGFLKQSLDIKKFTAASQTATIHLHPFQIGNISDGYIVFLAGDLNNHPFLSILKVEPQEGSALEWDKSQSSKNRLDHIERLLMTNSASRLYKFAFIHYSPRRKIYVLDPQIGSSDGDVADFWLKKFLQCDFKKSPDIRTKEAYDFIDKLCNRAEIPDEDNIRLRRSFVTEIVSNNTSFDLIDFRDQHVKKKLHSVFDDEVTKTGIDISTFPKDVKRIKRKLQTIVINFDHGIQLKLPYAEWGKSVKKVGKNIVQINKKILNINGKKP